MAHGMKRLNPGHWCGLSKSGNVVSTHKYRYTKRGEIEKWKVYVWYGGEKKWESNFVSGAKASMIAGAAMKM